MQAHDLIEQPDDQVRELMTAAEQASERSESQARSDVVCDDGSVLTVVSFRGEPAELYASADGIGYDDDGELLRDGDGNPLQPATPAPAPVPRVPESPPPSGRGDDGVLRDADGREVEEA